MTTAEFIKLLQEADPSGEMKIIANCPRFDYPVGFDAPEIGYMTKDWDWPNQDDVDDIERVILVRVDS